MLHGGQTSVAKAQPAERLHVRLECRDEVDVEVEMTVTAAVASTLTNHYVRRVVRGIRSRFKIRDSNPISRKGMIRA